MPHGEPGASAGGHGHGRPLKLVKVNVDDSPRLQQRFGVQSIPTLLVMREGKVTSRQVGAAPAAALRSWVEQALAA